MQDQLIPYGYCHCGCGEKAPIAQKTENRRSIFKGEPMRYVRDHYAPYLPGVPYDVEDRGHATPCWVWNRATNCYGYGVLNRKRKRTSAHRWYYEQEIGEIPEGLDLDHLCSVRACVNPAHLEPVTERENVRRSKATKLTLPDVREIKRRLATEGRGVGVALAREFGVTSAAIHSIKTGKTWADA